MKRSNRLLILLGLLIAISAALLAGVYVSSGSGGGGGGGGGDTAQVSPTPTAEPPVTLVCAKKNTDIQVGTTITADLVELCTKTVSDRDGAGPGTFTNISDVVGKIAGEAISKGSIIVASKDFYTNGSVIAGKSLSNSIKSGKVAVSMEVDQVNGVGTLIVPGDHVDVILSVYIEQMAITETLTGNNGGISTLTAGGSQLTSKMIFRNCRVLATLLPADLAVPTAAALATPVPSGPIATAEPSNNTVNFTGRHEYVILEVTPEEAEVVRWAQRSEKQDPQNYIDLGLALRSSSDNGTDADLATIPGGGKDAQPGGITLSQMISVYGVLPPDPLSTLPSALGAKVKW